MLNIPQFIASTSQLSMHTPAPSTMQAVIVEFVPNTVWYDPIGKHTQVPAVEGIAWVRIGTINVCINSKYT
jgi:hypothetical protein